ncbi:hypothetical protein ES703_121185 [subsurface metagenome]
MTKRGAWHSEEDYLDWFWRMDFTPEELTDIWTARAALAKQLEGTLQYPGWATQMSRVDWYVQTVSRPSILAGVRQTVGWHPLGYYERRYAIKGLRGLFGWERTKGIIFERTGITPAAPFGPP